VQELQGTHPEHKNKLSDIKAKIVQTQSWRCKTIAAIKGQQQTTTSIKFALSDCVGDVGVVCCESAYEVV